MASPLSRLKTIKLPRATAVGVNRAVLTTTLVLALVGASIGAGYHVARPQLGTGSAFLQRGHHVARINADSGSVDARTAKALADGRQRLQVVQVDPKTVLVVNNDSGDTYYLPTDTMRPQNVQHRPESAGQLRVVAGGGKAYAVDSTAGTISTLPTADAGDHPAVGPPAAINTPVKVDQAVVDGAGAAWAYAPSTGELLLVEDRSVTNHWRAAGAGEHVLLTLVGGRPVLYRPDSGQVVSFDKNGPQRRFDLLARGVPSAPQQTGDLLAVTIGTTDTVMVADFGTGEVRQLHLPDRAGPSLGAAVIHGGRAYLPDYTNRQVIVLNLANSAVEATTPVPGRDGDDPFEITAHDGRVWVNDPFQSQVSSFDESGHLQQIDDEPSQTTTPTKTSATPPPTSPPMPTATTTPSAPPASTEPPRLVTVPPLAGIDRAQACQILHDASLQCVPVAVPDGDGETNKVLRTDPKSGSKVTERTRISVFYRGPASVPNLIGLPDDQACRAIETAKLACVGQVTGLANNATEVRRVTTQQYPEGTTLATGTRVTITYPVDIRVPTVTGLDPTAACAAITAANLACTRQDLGSAAGTGQPVNVVIGQNPQAQTAIAPTGAVTVSSYSNNNVAVPSVTGVDPGTACAALSQAHLTCLPIPDAITSTPNVVIGQDPPAATVVAAGSGVRVVYEDNGPTLLHRYKAPGTQRANFITTGVGGPAGWSNQSDLGAVYTPAQAGSVPQLMQIYQYHCASCTAGGGEGYYFTPTVGTMANYVNEGPAFACFTVGTTNKTLHTLWHNGTKSWAWAVPGSGEYNHFTSTGFVEKWPMCDIW